jgi:hypothetical protein
MGGTNRNISVRAVGDFSNLSQGLQSAQNQIQSFGDRVKSKFAEIGEVGRGIKYLFEVFKEVGESVGELANRAAELDGGMSSLNRTLGSSAVGYMEWANSTAKSFGISKMSAIEYGKSIAMLLGDVYKDQGQLAAATEQLMQGGAVIAAKTGKSQQEVYEELNSALMGHAAAVKSLDINIMENALVHSQAYKQIANGAPWVKLSIEQQQYIRITELNRQIQQKFGDTIGNGMDARLMLFKGSLDDLKTSLAEAFMPILYRVLPILTTFLGWIQTAINYVAAFFQVLFGYSGIHAGATAAIQGHTDAVSALGDAYSTAGTKAINASKSLSGSSRSKKSSNGSSSSKKSSNTGFVANFDEVHNITKASDSSSGGATGSGAAGGSGANVAGGLANIANPLNSINDQVKGVSDNLEKFREKVAGFANAVKGFFQGIGNFFKNNFAGITGILAGIATYMLIAFGPQILEAVLLLIDKAFEPLVKLIPMIGEALMAINPVALVIAAVVAILTMVFIELFNTNKTFHDDVIALWEGLKKAWGDVVNAFGDLIHGNFSGFLTDMKKAWSDISPAFQKAWNDLWKWLTGVWSAIGGWFYDHVGKPIEDTWNSLKNSASKAMNDAWNAFKSPFVDAYSWFNNNVISKITGSFSDIVSGLKKTFNGILDFVNGIFSGNWSKAWRGIKEIFSGIFESLYGYVKTPLNLIIDAINTVISGLDSLSFKVPSWVPGFGGKTWGINIPHIPKLAQGGIIDRPTIAQIGEAGPEAVVPLENTSFVDKLASALGTAVMNAMSTSESTGSSGDIVIKLNDIELGRATAISINKAQRVSGRLLLDL